MLKRLEDCLREVEVIDMEIEYQELEERMHEDEEIREAIMQGLVELGK